VTIRRFRIKVDKDLREQFISRLLDVFKGEMVRVNLREDHVEIVAYGSEDSVKSLWSNIKSVLKELKLEKEAKVKGYTRVSIRGLYQAIGGTIPMEILEIISKLTGEKFIITSDEAILTSMSEDKLLNYALKARDVMNEIKYDVRGKACKNLIMIMASLMDLTGEEVVDILKRFNAVEEDEEGKIMLVENWKNVLRKVIKEFNIKADIESV